MLWQTLPPSSSTSCGRGWATTPGLEICKRQHSRSWNDTAASSLPTTPPFGSWPAIGSICFGLPTPAVDGNVLRVCSRLTADSAPIDKPQTKKDLTAKLAAVYPQGRCGDFTQALMELGATVCAPNGAPHCEACPLSAICQAHKEGIETELPIKTPKKPRRVEEMTVFLLHREGDYALNRRPNTGLLAGLWEFPHVSGKLELEAALVQLEAWGAVPEEIERSVERTHIFTHVQWEMRGLFLRCKALPPDFVHGKPEAYALPTAFRLFLEGTDCHVGPLRASSQ